MRREDKFGGRPWSLPRERWPTCAECGHAMALLAELGHATSRLDLGREGRVLFMFRCSSTRCEVWEPSAGASAAFVVEPEALVESPPAPPADVDHEDIECRIVDWLTIDEGIAPELASRYRSPEACATMSDDELRRATFGTRFGGVPRWTELAGAGPSAEWLFAFQLDGAWRANAAPAAADDFGGSVTTFSGGAARSVERPSFDVRPWAPSLTVFDGVPSWVS